MVTVAAIGPIIKLVKSAYEVCKPNIDEYRSNQNIQENLLLLYSRSFELRKCKTLINPEKPIDIREIFVAPNLRHRKKKISIDSIRDFVGTDNVLIIGMAGQGKSTYMRHLCAKEMDDPETIPIFVVLKNISQENPLDQLMKKSLIDFGFKVPDEVFCYLANEGGFSVFLDGFDEISDDLRNPFLADVESFSMRFPKCKIILTSRPGYQIEFNNKSSVYEVMFFDFSQISELIKKLTPEYKELLDELSKPERRNIQSLVKTPMMATLLVINHRAFRQIPRVMTEFYDNLFEHLLRRHDEIKFLPRKRVSGLDDDSKFKQIFSFIAFEISKNPSQILSKQYLEEIISRAVKNISPSTAAYLFLDDISKITGLLFSEGREYHYIHETIREYFAAYYIARYMEPTVKIQLYGRFLTLSGSGKVGRWMPTIDFLATIDKFFHLQYFKIPYLRYILTMDNDSGHEIKLPDPHEFMRWCMGEVTIKFVSTNLHESEALNAQDTDAEIIKSIELGGLEDRFAPVFRQLISMILRVTTNIIKDLSLLQLSASEPAFEKPVIVLDLCQSDCNKCVKCVDDINKTIKKFYEEYSNAEKFMADHKDISVINDI